MRVCGTATSRRNRRLLASCVRVRGGGECVCAYVGAASLSAIRGSQYDTLDGVCETQFGLLWRCCSGGIFFSYVLFESILVHGLSNDLIVKEEIVHQV